MTFSLQFCAATALALAAAFPAAAQTWVPLTSSGAQQPGLPALVQIDAEASDSVTTVIGITLFGFWREQVEVEGVVYDRITVPGLGRIGQVGAPDLPAERMDLAVSGKAVAFQFDGTSFASVVTYEGYYPLPTYAPATEAASGATPASFTLDPAIYGGAAQWPADYAAASTPVVNVIGPIEGATVAINPMRWDPSTGVLHVAKSMSASFSQVGGASAAVAVTKLKSDLAAIHFENWEDVSFHYVYDPSQYFARYLILADHELWSTLDQFESHKWSFGYQMATMDAPGSVAGVRDAIASWYHLGDPAMDHFVLLVGDEFELGTASQLVGGSTFVKTDDPYAEVGTPDGVPEVHLGRLAIDDAADLHRQLQKIIQYERNPPSGDYHEALMVSHQGTAATNFAGEQVDVANAGYASPPSFLMLYGAPFGENALLASTLVDSVGLVAYRGFGTEVSWPEWTINDESLLLGDVDAFGNSVWPVVWSFAARNADIAVETLTSEPDSMGESWMSSEGGGVAFYGAIGGVETEAVTELQRVMFELLYDQGVSTQGIAIDAAEQVVLAQWPDSVVPWTFRLLGDPAMIVRRGPVFDLGLAQPVGEITAASAAFELPLNVTSTGDGIENGLVAAYKPSFLGGQPAEVHGAYWINSNHDVTVPIDVATPGTLLLTVRDGDGNFGQVEVEVTMGPAWEDLGFGLAGAEGAPRLAATGSLAGGQPWSLLLAGAPPGAPAFQCIAFDEAYLPLFGGTLVPDVLNAGVVSVVGTDEYGNHVLAGDWPDGIPSGKALAFQYWVVDPTAPEGLSASNALRGTTP